MTLGVVERALRSALQGPRLERAGVGVAWSGGLDSTVLLHACVAQLGAERVVALHVHHDLQPAAEQFVVHCERVAASLGVPLQVLRLTRPQSSGKGQEAKGQEAWARAQRYRVIADAARERELALTLTAHHRDDQAETVLHRLMRGSGAAGMSAIRPMIEHRGHTFARPLLGVSRAALEAYANEHRLDWIEDPTNQDQGFTRNAIRHRVMPAIDAVSPGVSERIARAAAHWQDANSVLNDYLDADLARMVTPLATGAAAPLSVLDATLLTDLPLARAQLLLRRWIEHSGERAPDQARSQEMAQQCLAPDARYAQIDHDSVSLLRYRQQVFLVPHGREMIARLAQCRLALPWQWQPDGPLRLPAPYPTLRTRRVASGPGLDGAWLQGRAWRLRSHWPMAARLRVTGARHAKSLKDLLQAAAVPEWLRPMALVLASGDEVIALAGVGAAASLPWTESGERWTIELDWSDDAGSEESPERQLAQFCIGNKLL